MQRRTLRFATILILAANTAGVSNAQQMESISDTNYADTVNAINQLIQQNQKLEQQNRAQEQQNQELEQQNRKLVGLIKSLLPAGASQDRTTQNGFGPNPVEK